METNNDNYPAIYYVIQGRATENDNNYIEHSFMDINPLVARERAFSYLEYYVQLLHQGKKLFFREKESLVNKQIELDNIHNYNITFAENNFGLDGIAVYMVVNKPIKYMEITDKKEERYLIYSIKNLTETNFETIKNGLIREYGYYRNSNIETKKFEDELIIMNDSKSNYYKNQNIVYTILKTPINFVFTASKINDSKFFLENVLHDFKVIDLQKTTFISKLNWHIIKMHIASFINTNGGRVYLGKFINKQIMNCIEETSLAKCNQILKSNIFPDFLKHKHFLSFRYVTINKVFVPIIEVKSSNRNLSFYNNNSNNSFYYRTKKGLEVMNDTQKIAEYVIKNSETSQFNLDEILDKL